MCDGTQAPAVFAVSGAAIGGAVFSSVLILKVQLAAGFISPFVCYPPPPGPPLHHCTSLFNNAREKLSSVFVSDPLSHSPCC